MPPPSSKTEAELRREVNKLRQLLQAGVALATAALADDDVRDDLKKWIAAATSEASSD